MAQSCNRPAPIRFAARSSNSIGQYGYTSDQWFTLYFTCSNCGQPSRENRLDSEERMNHLVTHPVHMVCEDCE